MAACCLCKKDVKSDKKKRKLHNEACREEKKLLEQFLQTSIAKELSDFEETKGEDRRIARTHRLLASGRSVTLSRLQRDILMNIVISMVTAY